jgi:hypothetical protein
LTILDENVVFVLFIPAALEFDSFFLGIFEFVDAGKLAFNEDLVLLKPYFVVDTGVIAMSFFFN